MTTQGISHNSGSNKLTLPVRTEFFRKFRHKHLLVQRVGKTCRQKIFQVLNHLNIDFNKMKSKEQNDSLPSDFLCDQPIPAQFTLCFSIYQCTYFATPTVGYGFGHNRIASRADWEENQNNKFSAEHVKSMVSTSKNQE